MVHLRVPPLYILRPSNPSPQRFPLPFSPLFSSLSYPLFSAISLPSANKLPSHHHHLPWQWWLLLVPQVKAVLPRRGQKFKSSVYSQTFWESGQHHLAVLLYSWHFRQSTCGKKEEEKKNAGLRGFLDVQGHNTQYWCGLEVISVHSGVTWFSVRLLRSILNLTPYLKV